MFHCKKSSAVESDWHAIKGPEYDEFNRNFNAPYGSSTFSDMANIILSDNVRLGLAADKTHIAPNVLVVGGGGAEKGRSYVKPNILNMGTSFVIHDVGGELYNAVADALISNGYKVKTLDLNTLDSNNGCKYNPFKYINNYTELYLLVKLIVDRTGDVKSQGTGDPFWTICETRFLAAIFCYIYFYLPEEKHNFRTVFEMLKKAESSDSSKCELDLIFEAVANRGIRPDGTKYLDNEGNVIPSTPLRDGDVCKEEPLVCHSVNLYADFCNMAEKVRKAIMISAYTRLQIFNQEKVLDFMSDDTVGLDELNKEKQALFLITSPGLEIYDILAEMVCTQTLYCLEKEVNNNEGVHVHFMLDEAQRIYIPDFACYLSTGRKYGISFSIVMQSLMQLKNLYKDDWENIMANCGAQLYMGSSSMFDLEWISKALGTITYKCFSSKSSWRVSIDDDVRPLMKPAELRTMPADECIVLINGQKPFRDKKYNPDSVKKFSDTDYDNEDFEDYECSTSRIAKIVAGVIIGVVVAGFIIGSCICKLFSDKKKE